MKRSYQLQLKRSSASIFLVIFFTCRRYSQLYTGRINNNNQTPRAIGNLCEMADDVVFRSENRSKKIIATYPRKIRKLIFLHIKLKSKNFHRNYLFHREPGPGQSTASSRGSGIKSS